MRGETSLVPCVRVNDIELYYELQGEGSPVLLVPGLGVDIRSFRRVIDDLATSCRVAAIGPSLPSTATSSWPKSNASWG